MEYPTRLNPDDESEGNSPRTEETTNTPENKKHSGFFIEILKFVVITVVIVVPVRLFVAQPFIVSGASMEPSFETGQYIIVDQISYAFEAPKRGEVIIFRYPKDTTKFFIKRVIGLPNETMELKGGNVIIKNSKNPDGFILDEPYIKSDNLNSQDMAITLKDDEYFVMGDNRHASSDSRIWGPLEEKFVIGRAFLRLFPIREGGVFPGSHTDSQ